MPGSSLWLLPPPSHPLNDALASYIRIISAQFGSQHTFLPHVTLTSEISSSKYSPDPQKWLDNLQLPAGKDVKVILGQLASEDVFVRKLYFKVEKEGVCDIGKCARAVVEGFEDEEAARTWAEEKYNPHLSLLYHDCPKISDGEIAQIENLTGDINAAVGGPAEPGAWIGGTVVLVPTDRPIKDWEPIAARAL